MLQLGSDECDNYFFVNFMNFKKLTVLKFVQIREFTGTFKIRKIRILNLCCSPCRLRSSEDAPALHRQILHSGRSNYNERATTEITRFSLQRLIPWTFENSLFKQYFK